MLKTQNYGFNKPELSDSPPDITVMNPNWDNIDKKIKENTDAIAQNSEAIGTVKTEITKMDMSWDKISGKPNSFVPSAHSHTKADIGLGSVQNYGVATQAQVDEGKANNLYVTPLSLASLKQSVVNGKQAVVNAINDSLGYASGLATNNTHDDYSWWIRHKLSKPYFNNITLKSATINTHSRYQQTTFPSGSFSGGAIISINIQGVNINTSNLYIVEFDWDVNIISGVLYISSSKDIIVPGGKIYKSTHSSFGSSVYWALSKGVYTKFRFMFVTNFSRGTSEGLTLSLSNPYGITEISQQPVVFSAPNYAKNIKVYEAN